MLKFSVVFSLMMAVAFTACQDHKTIASEPSATSDSPVTKTSDDTVTKISDDTADSLVSITVTAPEDGATVPERSVIIRGNFTEPKPSYRLSARPNNFVGSVRKAVRKEGKFDKYYMLDIGDNDITLEVVDIENDYAVVASKALRIHHMPNSPAIGFFPQAKGGDIRVENKESAIFGAALSIAPGTFRRDVWARLEDYQDQRPNLPKNYIRVGSSVSVFPLGETFASPAILTIPFLAGLIPPEYSDDDVLILALTNRTWSEVPSQRVGDMAVVTIVEKSFYPQYIAALKKPAK